MRLEMAKELNKLRKQKENLEAALKATPWWNFIRRLSLLRTIKQRQASMNLYANAR